MTYSDQYLMTQTMSWEAAFFLVSTVYCILHVCLKLNSNFMVVDVPT